MDPFTLFFLFGLGTGVLLGVLVFVIVKIMDRRWKIPMTILRYTGDKRRPLLVLTKGMKEVIDNNVQLRVKGYRRRFRDFHQKNYYPSPGTPFGGIICFEFEDGWLTPVVPGLKKLTDAQRAEAHSLIDRLNGIMSDVEFQFDQTVHDALKLNIVDDVDSESFLIDQTRIRQQYQGALSWLATHGTTVVLVVLLICLTVGFVMWVKESPANAAQACVSQLRNVCSDAWNITINENPQVGERIIAGLTNSVTGGVPPG